MYSRIAGRILLAASILSLGACTNPYDPGQRAIGGAALGAGGGAALGAIAGGGRGAAIGALAGGALGAVGGAVTTPQQNAYPAGYYQRPAPGRYGY
ncbi:OmpA family protein [Granulibacter bethesdensis]|uniref:OmpA family protein n=1 Tax=Granulibacter bethesdensis TaxID=364410 RepID=A0AAC9KDG3_9PROT|nr:YMGG-like glycine zipper-containing protein [Granulibacter bethesdensis]APH53985.1 OmpA family protein [Granulibacter bethesdensis]APH61566.1 OmpA family protein [Granulibacter bethesdensis]